MNKSKFMNVKELLTLKSSSLKMEVKLLSSDRLLDPRLILWYRDKEVSLGL